MPSYRLVFRGLLPEHTPESFADALAGLLALPAEQIAVVLSPRGVVLACGLQQQNALCLQATFIQKGCLCAIEAEQEASVLERFDVRRLNYFLYGVVLTLLLMALFAAALLFLPY